MMHDGKSGTCVTIQALRITFREFVFGDQQPERGVREGSWVYVFRRRQNETTVHLELRSGSDGGFTHVSWTSPARWAKTPRASREPGSSRRDIVTLMLEPGAEIFVCLSRTQLPYLRLKELCDSAEQLRARCQAVDLGTAPRVEIDGRTAIAVYLHDYMEAVECLQGRERAEPSKRVFHDLTIERRRESQFMGAHSDYLSFLRDPDVADRWKAGGSDRTGPVHGYSTAVARLLAGTETSRDERADRLRLAYLARDVSSHVFGSPEKVVYHKGVPYESTTKLDDIYDHEALEEEIASFEQVQQDVEWFAHQKHVLMQHPQYAATCDDYMFDVDYKATAKEGASQSLKAAILGHAAAVIDLTFLSEPGQAYLLRELRDAGSWYRRYVVDTDPGVVFQREKDADQDANVATILANIGFVLPAALGVARAENACRRIIESWTGRPCTKHEGVAEGPARTSPPGHAPRLDLWTYLQSHDTEALLEDFEIDAEGRSHWEELLNRDLSTKLRREDLELALKSVETGLEINDEFQLFRRTRFPFVPVMGVISLALTVTTAHESDEEIMMGALSATTDVLGMAAIFVGTLGGAVLGIFGGLLTAISGLIGALDAFQEGNLGKAAGHTLISLGGASTAIGTAFLANSISASVAIGTVAVAWTGVGLLLILAGGVVVYIFSEDEGDEYEEWFRASPWGVDADPDRTVAEHTQALLDLIMRPRVRAEWQRPAPRATVRLFLDLPFWLEAESEATINAFELRGKFAAQWTRETYENTEIPFEANPKPGSPPSASPRPVITGRWSVDFNRREYHPDMKNWIAYQGNPHHYETLPLMAKIGFGPWVFEKLRLCVKYVEGADGSTYEYDQIPIRGSVYAPPQQEAGAAPPEP